MFKSGVARRTAAIARQVVGGSVIEHQLMSSSAAVRLGRIAPQDTALFICDVQERFRSVISGFPAVVDTSRRMARAAQALQLPIIVTEQYPKALGNTVPELAEILPQGTPIVAKTDFSMCVPDVVTELEKLSDVKNILLTGIEAHVCVFQTALDLLEKGYAVHILVDGVSSQRFTDRSTALHRLSQAGAYMVTSEMVMFQLMKNTAHPAFKTISGLCKETRVEQLPAL